MNIKFINSIKRRVTVLKKDHVNNRYQKAEKIIGCYVHKKVEEISDFQIAFFELYESKDLELQDSSEKFTNLLGEQKYYRQNIGYGVSYRTRELRLPEDNSSEWELLFETTVDHLQESGPILHLYYDGWKIVRYKIYYWDERDCYDISKEEELIAAKIVPEKWKNKIAETGYKIPDSIDDDGILKIKNMDDYFPNYIQDE